MASQGYREGPYSKEKSCDLGLISTKADPGANWPGHRVVVALVFGVYSHSGRKNLNSRLMPELRGQSTRTDCVAAIQQAVQSVFKMPCGSSAGAT